MVGQVLNAKRGSYKFSRRKQVRNEWLETSSSILVLAVAVLKTQGHEYTGIRLRRSIIETQRIRVDSKPKQWQTSPPIEVRRDGRGRCGAFASLHL